MKTAKGEYNCIKRAHNHTIDKNSSAVKVIMTVKLTMERYSIKRRGMIKQFHSPVYQWRLNPFAQV